MIIKNSEPLRPLYTFVVPGARALGEDWVKVTVGHRGGELERSQEAVEAPADNQSVIVPGPLETEHINYILEWQRERAEERVKSPQEMTPEERHRVMNEMWHDYVNQKLKLFQGTSQIGASGVLTQRQRLIRR